MDPLSDVLQLLRLHSTVLFRAPLVDPWGFAVPVQPGHIPVYSVQGASCYLTIDGDSRSVLVQDGDVVWLPQGSGHRLQSHPASPVLPVEEWQAYAGASYLDGVPLSLTAHTTYLLAGSFAVAHTIARPILTPLGVLIQVHADDIPARQSMASLIELIAMELQTQQPGSQTAASQLMEVLFIHLIRDHLAQHRHADQSCDRNVLFATFDPVLSKAVDLIHQQPNQAWTVAKLAAATGLSRTAFATRFSQVAGVPPLTYVRQWRMLKARNLLAHTAVPLSRVAEEVGYDSVAAFSTAFKREVGVAPGLYRQQPR